MKRGLFISIDGPDYTGKSTQAVLLEKYLTEKGRKIIRTREPGTINIPACAAIRNILLNPDYQDQITSAAELCLFSADRAVHMSYLIKPNLEAGIDVITDRFEHSTTVYQGIAGKLSLETVLLLNKIVTQGIEPDIEFFLDADFVTVERKRVYTEYGKPDRIESNSPEFHQRVTEGFRALAQIFPERIKLIPYREGRPEVMQDQIRVYVNRLIEVNMQK